MSDVPTNLITAAIYRHKQLRLCRGEDDYFCDVMQSVHALEADPFAIPATYLICTTLQCNFDLYRTLSFFSADGEVMRCSYQSPKHLHVEQIGAVHRSIDVHGHYAHSGPDYKATIDFRSFDNWGPINAN